MFRTPPRREPRVAALVHSRRGMVLVVLDPWEVRAVLVSRQEHVVRVLLGREEPVLLFGTRKLPKRIANRVLHTEIVDLPKRTLPLSTYPELRRFARTPLELPVRQALTLASDALTLATV